MPINMLFDFKCDDCDVTQEGYVTSDVHAVVCDSCGGISQRVISMPMFILDGTDPDFPTAYAGWEKKRLSKQDS